MGKCGACIMQVNGKVQLGCAVRLVAYEFYVVETIANKEVIRDLITK
jgi:succinate dehydrogenase/fumarate reductase-like Fe-S protein